MWDHIQTRRYLRGRCESKLVRNQDRFLNTMAEANDGASKHGAGKRRCNNARRISTAAPAKTVEFATGAPNLGQGRGTQVGVS